MCHGKDRQGLCLFVGDTYVLGSDSKPRPLPVMTPHAQILKQNAWTLNPQNLAAPIRSAARLGLKVGAINAAAFATSDNVARICDPYHRGVVALRNRY